MYVAVQAPLLSPPAHLNPKPWTIIDHRPRTHLSSIIIVSSLTPVLLSDLTGTKKPRWCAFIGPGGPLFSIFAQFSDSIDSITLT